MRLAGLEQAQKGEPAIEHPYVRVGRDDGRQALRRPRRSESRYPSSPRRLRSAARPAARRREPPGVRRSRPRRPRRAVRGDAPRARSARGRSSSRAARRVGESPSRTISADQRAVRRQALRLGDRLVAEPEPVAVLRAGQEDDQDREGKDEQGRNAFRMTDARKEYGDAAGAVTRGPPARGHRAGRPTGCWG